MIVIIPAAGNGDRFGLAGYQMPKPSLPMPGGGTLVERVIKSLPQSPTDRLFVVTQAKYARALSAPLFVARMARQHLDLVTTPTLTDGPLASVLAAARWLHGREDLLINYCDCFLERGECEQFANVLRKSSWDAGAVVFDSLDERYSHAPESRKAVGGVFWFREARQFLKHAKRLVWPGAGVPDVVWSFTQFDVPRYGTYRADHYVDLGVPKDYETYVMSAPLPAGFVEAVR